MKKLAFLSLLLVGSLACATLEKTLATEVPPTVAAPPTAAPNTTDAAPTDIVRRENSDVVCSSEIPEAVEAYNQGFALETAGDINAAIAAYRKAIELDPEYCDAMDNLALLLRQIGENQEAISLYQKSIEIAPDNLVAHLGLANAYMDLDEYDKALEEYNTLIEIDPDYAEGYYGAGRAYFSQENYTQAIAQLKIAEDLYKAEGSPYVVDAQVLLGLSYTLIEDYVNGRDYLELAYPQMQDNAYVNYFLGYCYYYGASIRDDALARKYLTRARDLGVELEPELENFVNSSP